MKKEFDADNFAKEKKNEFFKMIFEDKLQDLTFVLDLSQGKKGYTALSKHNQGKIVYPLEGVMQKLKAIYKEVNPENYMTFDKGDFAIIADSIPNVDYITTDLTRKPGLFKSNGFAHYNHWNRSEMMLLVESFNEGRPEVEYENLDWSSYSNINFLINHLLNIEENEAVDNSKKIIDLKKHFINWLACCLQKNEKTGMYYLFISPTQGTGKNVFLNIIKSYYGSDYYAEINNDTLLSTHNKLIEGKLFLGYNESEINARDYDKVNSKLKTLITEDEIIIRAMYKDQDVQKSLCNMIMNSNLLVPTKIEADDRRANVVRTSGKALKQAVKERFNIDVTEFVKSVEEESFIFLCDLLNLKTDRKKAKFNAVMTDAKKLIIKSTNTQASNVISLMEKNDEAGLREYFSECERDDLIEEFLKQVNSRFLTNDIVNKFLHANLRDEGKESEGKTSKKIYWDKKIGTAVNVPYTNIDGKKTSVSVRKLSGFRTQNIQGYFNDTKEFYEEDDESLKNEFDELFK